MATAIGGVYHWTHQKSLVCAQIAARRGTLTIGLKTKDDPFFLDRWISHHARIVGLRHLLILDNMSTDDAVKDVYKKYEPELLVVQFDELNNLVHHVPTFREMYHTLASSTTFFVFLDTDEFLVRMDDGSFHEDSSIVEFIRSCGDVNWLPGTWLTDAFRSDTVFKCGTDPSTLLGGLLWGKPVIRAGALVKSAVELNHNVQVCSMFAGTRTRTNLFVLHMRNLSPEQRIPSLLRRLAARRRFTFFSDDVRNLVEDGDDLAAILAKPSKHLPASIQKELTDLRRLVAIQADGARPIGHLQSGHVRLKDGQIDYYSDVERDLFRRFLSDPDGIVQEAFADAAVIRAKAWPVRREQS